MVGISVNKPRHTGYLFKREFRKFPFFLLTSLYACFICFAAPHSIDALTYGKLLHCFHIVDLHIRLYLHYIYLLYCIIFNFHIYI